MDQNSPQGGLASLLPPPTNWKRPVPPSNGTVSMHPLNPGRPPSAGDMATAQPRPLPSPPPGVIVGGGMNNPRLPGTPGAYPGSPPPPTTGGPLPPYSEPPPQNLPYYPGNDLPVYNGPAVPGGSDGMRPPKTRDWQTGRDGPIPGDRENGPYYPPGRPDNTLPGRGPLPPYQGGERPGTYGRPYHGNPGVGRPQGRPFQVPSQFRPPGQFGGMQPGGPSFRGR